MSSPIWVRRLRPRTRSARSERAAQRDLPWRHADLHLAVHLTGSKKGRAAPEARRTPVIDLGLVGADTVARAQRRANGGLGPTHAKSCIARRSLLPLSRAFGGWGQRLAPDVHGTGARHTVKWRAGPDSSNRRLHPDRPRESQPVEANCGAESSHGASRAPGLVDLFGKGPSAELTRPS
jgi:hypothetical protein